VRPGEESNSPPGAEPQGDFTPMSPPDCTHRASRSGRAGRRSSPAHRPRTRRCLLKGCERRFRPQRAQERYCSRGCRQAARKWSRWKAQQRYRATAAAREKRNGQSRRYRARVCSRIQTTPEESLAEGDGNHSKIFRPQLRPSRLLQRLRGRAAISCEAVLFARLPAGHGAGLAARAALAPRLPTGVEKMRWAISLPY
jgi:hypothetical protein